MDPILQTVACTAGMLVAGLLPYVIERRQKARGRTERCESRIKNFPIKEENARLRATKIDQQTVLQGLLSCYVPRYEYDGAIVRLVTRGEMDTELGNKLINCYGMIEKGYKSNSWIERWRH